MDNNQNYQGNNQGNQNFQNNYNTNVQNQNIPNQVSAAPAEAPVAEPPKKKKNTLKAIIIAIIALLLVGGIAVGGFFAYKHFANKKEEEPKEETQVPVLENIAPENASTIEFYPDRNVSAGDIEKFAKIIEERAAVLGENFKVTYDDKKISMAIEKSMLGNSATERSHTIELLMSRGTFGFSFNGYTPYSSSPAKDTISAITVSEYNRADILSDYSSSFTDERYKQIEAISADKIYGITVQFDSDGALALDNILKYSSSTSKLTASHNFQTDYTSEGYKFLANAILENSDDASVVHLISPAAAYSKNADLMKKILEQESLDFGLVMQILDEPAWDAADAKNRGANQVDSLEGDTVVVEVTPNDFTRSYNSEVEFADYEKLVKKRLDVLGIDYMFGTTGFDDKTYCVKLSPQSISPDLLRLVFCEKYISVRSAFDYVSGFGEPKVVEKDGKPAIRVETYSTSAEILADSSLTNNTVYLVVNDVTIASADLSNIQDGEDSYLDFENFLCFGNKDVTDDEQNFLELVCSIYSDSYISFEGSFRFCRYENGSVTVLGLDDANWKYSYLTGEDERVKSIISGMGCEMEKNADARNDINIYIDLPLDQNLPVNFTEKVKEIYTACNFDSGSYNKINFIIKNEAVDSPADRFRIEAYKDSLDSKMILNDYVSGPKFFEYWSATYDITESDDFFTARSW